MKFLPYLLILTIFECCYYKLAKAIKINASVTERSSHKANTPTTGGMIFIVATFLFALDKSAELTPDWATMLGSTFTLGAISFIDDIHPLPAKPRLALQIAILALLMMPYFSAAAPWCYLLFIFFGVGCINSYNFIDGIDGILALLAAVVIGSLLHAYMYFLPQNAELYINFGYIVLLAIAVFLPFNLLNKLFAGDVGSITIGLFIVWLMTDIIFQTGDATLAILSIVCIADTALTAIQRLCCGENILKPHCKHIYQTLTHRWGVSQVAVATCYAATQLIINILYFLTPPNFHIPYTVSVCIMLTFAYIFIRKSARSGKFRSENPINSCKCD